MKKILLYLTTVFILFSINNTKILSKDNLTEKDLDEKIEKTVNNYLKEHNVSEIYELSDLDINILSDIIENEKNKFYNDNH